MTEPWWKSAVVYQIYPRSFADSGGDGIGDLEGIRRHLDHLAWLGVDALWLSPVYRSPMADFGYDVSDFCAIDQVFGSLDDMDRLIADAHAAGLRVILDWVPNHTSDQHPWFVESRSSRTSPKRDWYVWRDAGADGTPPNNWVASFAPEPTWTHDPTTDQSYLHLFLPEQPDLNWANPEVEAAMHDVLRFWLDRGVDGFRADVVHAIGKDAALVDDAPELVGLPHSVLHDEPTTHDLLRRIRTLLDGYPGDRVMVGEVYLLDIDRMATYYGHDDELHLSFNFLPVHAPWRAAPWREYLRTTEAALGARGAWPTWVLSNHDVPRHRTRFANDLDLSTPSDAARSEARARAAAVLLLSARGTPFLYQGEELGLLDADVPPAGVVDPGGRDGCRAPIPWSADPGHGWGTATEPWLPFPPEVEQRNVQSERDDPESILHLYRRLLQDRRDTPALVSGSFELLDAPDAVIAFRRGAPSDPGHRVIVVNTSGEPQAVPLEGEYSVVVRSDAPRAPRRAYSGSVGADLGLILAPA